MLPWVRRFRTISFFVSGEQSVAVDAERHSSPAGSSEKDIKPSGQLRLGPVHLFVATSLELRDKSFRFLSAESSIDDKPIAVVILPVNGPRLLRHRCGDNRLGTAHHDAPFFGEPGA